MEILYVGLGGALGAVLRFVVSEFVKGSFHSTLLINLIGSFCIGVIWAIMENKFLHAHVQLFFIVGILGGFTTFSTYMLDTFKMTQSGHINAAIIYFLLSNILGILCLVGGFFMYKYVIIWIK